MIPPNDELRGFVLIKNPSRDNILLNIGTNILINSAAKKAIGGAEYVNIFLDEFGKRIMIRKAEKDNENIFRVTKYKISDSKKLKKMILSMLGEEKFSDQVVSYSGHKVKTSDSLIFDLTKIYATKKFQRGKK